MDSLRRPSTAQELRHLHQAPASEGRLPKQRLMQEHSPMHQLSLDRKGLLDEKALYEAQKEFIEVLLIPESRRDIDDEFLATFLDIHGLSTEDEETFEEYFDKNLYELQEELNILTDQIQTTEEEIYYIELQQQLLSLNASIKRVRVQESNEDPDTHRELQETLEEVQIKFLQLHIKREIHHVYDDIQTGEQEVDTYTQKRNQKRSIINKYNKTINKKKSKEEQSSYDNTVPALLKEVEFYERKIRHTQGQINGLKQVPKQLAQKDTDLAHLETVRTQVQEIRSFTEVFYDHLLAATPIVTKEDIIVKRYAPWLELLEDTLEELQHHIRSILPTIAEQITTHPRQYIPALSVSDKQSFITALTDIKEILIQLHDSLQESSWIEKDTQFLQEAPGALLPSIEEIQIQLQKEVHLALSHHSR